MLELIIFCVFCCQSLLYMQARGRVAELRKKKNSRERFVVSDVLKVQLYPHEREGALVQIHGSSYWGRHMQQTLRQEEEKKSPSGHICMGWTAQTTLWCSLWASSFFQFFPPRNYGCMSQKEARLASASFWHPVIIAVSCVLLKGQAAGEAGRTERSAEVQRNKYLFFSLRHSSDQKVGALWHGSLLDFFFFWLSLNVVFWNRSLNQQEVQIVKKIERKRKNGLNFAASKMRKQTDLLPLVSFNSSAPIMRIEKGNNFPSRSSSACFELARFFRH